MAQEKVILKEVDPAKATLRVVDQAEATQRVVDQAKALRRVVDQARADQVEALRVANLQLCILILIQ